MSYRPPLDIYMVDVEIVMYITGWHTTYKTENNVYVSLHEKWKADVFQMRRTVSACHVVYR